MSLTSPAVSHGHFAHPGLSNGGTRYCVLGWFLNNMPCSGLQTPLIATGFVSPGAGSPLTPLADLATLCIGYTETATCHGMKRDGTSNTY